MKNLEALSLKVANNQLYILDQQLLPDEEKWLLVESVDHMVQIIKDLKVRGAPLIGIAASLSLALFTNENTTWNEFKALEKKLRESRPTAVNLMNALDRMLEIAERSSMDYQKIVEQAENLFAEDVELCLQMAKAGADLIEDGDNILTHCNTGGLATVGLGTALGVIVQAHQQGKKVHVYVDETRPLLQGGRLTTWELEQHNIPYTLICDNMSGKLMAEGKVQKVFVGADRIAMNGDFANKIGTYNLAVICSHHKVPFYTVAPQTTVDTECASGAGIPVEMRKPEEVRGIYGSFGEIRWAPKNAKVFNPAFDVTPCGLLTGIVLDGKVLSQGELKSGVLKRILNKG